MCSPLNLCVLCNLHAETLSLMMMFKILPFMFSPQSTIVTPPPCLIVGTLFLRWKASSPFFTSKRGYIIVAKQLVFFYQQSQVSVSGLFFLYAKHTFLFIYLYICFVFPTQKTVAESRNPDDR